MSWLSAFFRRGGAAGRAKYLVWIVTPPGYRHSRCFEEVALALQSAFRALGHEAAITTEPVAPGDQAIVLGPNLLPQLDPALYRDRKLTLYNLEQIYVGSDWLTPEYLSVLREFPVWDYSDQNIAELGKLGITDVTKCGIGYAPELSCIKRQADEDIDVLFIGTASDRRVAVVDALFEKGISVTVASDCYGRERDELIARAKVILNVHKYDARVFEIVRVSYMLANRKCVVSEVGFDRALEAPFADGVVFTAYERLVESCGALVRDADWRDRVASRGFEIFRSMPQAAMLASALRSREEPRP